ncbi:MAG: ankyrin repeat domain-containing protein [Planctomycetaceae bacterium]|nr:ankyrin repeat domain-containing protein [Planctomycetaceae bacterium]
MTSSHSRRMFIGAAGSAVALSVATATGLEQDPVPDEKGPKESAFERDYDAPKFKPSWAKEQVNRQLVQDFVIFAHSDLAMVQKLLDREPGLLNGAVDWGGGDFETALGGASHMGKHEIVEYLLAKGARIDIFCAAMLGQLDAIRNFLTLQPSLIDAKGPHGFTLHFHAQVGGERSSAVLDYLQSIKQVELKPIPFLRPKAEDKPKQLP